MKQFLGQSWPYFFSQLRVQLLALILLVLLPALLLSLYTASEQGRLASVAAQQEALRLAQLSASNQDQLISGAEQLLSALAQLPVMRNGNSDACNRLFETLHKQYANYTNLWVTRADGSTYCTGIPTSMNINVADRPWFKRAMATRGFSVSGYELGIASKRPLITLAYPVFDDVGNIILQVGVGLDLQWVSEFIKGTQLPPATVITAIDSKGTVLYEYPDPENDVGKPYANPALVAVVVAQGTGTIDARGDDGDDRLFGFSPLGKTNGTAYVLVGTSKGVAYGEANRLLTQSLAGLGAIGLLTLIAAWYGANRFLVRPIYTLVDGTTRLASGDLKTRIDQRLVQGTYELDKLSQSFNEMAEALERRTEELQTALARAQSADRAKSAMLSNVTHEMRTPLSSIIGFSNLLLSRSPETEKRAEYTTFINLEARRLARLINDFLDLQRIEDGRQGFKNTKLDLAELVQDVATGRQTAEADPRPLRLDMIPTHPVYADPERIRQVILNLLNNAIKYSTSGDITLRLYEQDGEVICSIRDQGIGIPRQEIDRLFERFFRGSEAERLRISGTGLGLALCSEIINGQGGRIWAESAGPGEGATFSFALPIMQADSIALPGSPSPIKPQA